MQRRASRSWPASVAVIAVVASLVLGGCGSEAVGPLPVGIRAEGCRAVAGKGSGFVVAPGIVLTSAHVVAGSGAVTVLFDTGVEVDADIVAFDPLMDLAYLRVPEGETVEAVVPVISGDAGHAGAEGRALVFRDGAPLAIDVEVRRRVRINTEDIYVEGATTRPGFELVADIEPGDSGSAVYVDGQVIGVLWARSRDGDHRSYAIDVGLARGLIDRQLATGELGPEIDLAHCS